MIFRVFVEKKKEFDVHAKKLSNELSSVLSIDTGVRVLIRYDYEGEKADFEAGLSVVFSEPPVDIIHLEALQTEDKMLCVEYLPGQFDQRSDSAEQCLTLLTRHGGHRVKCATVYLFSSVTDEQMKKIEHYLVNPVECRIAETKKPISLLSSFVEPQDEQVFDGFIHSDETSLRNYYEKGNYSFSFDDFLFIKEYFLQEGRDPFFAEIKLLDTYWSDHCRHTTFNTEITDVEIETDIEELSEAFLTYKKLFEKHHKGRRDKYVSMMDMGTIAKREIASRGLMPHIDESEEINACSIKIDAERGDKTEKWTVMFKNETHNHPTEIEPFGGAATCLGGAIRDPLSGRVYVYQSMRVTGAADITAPLSATIKGKLPQRVISKTAAAGFSSYGNQIGLATGEVREYFHKGYAAKRLETGFVVGGAKSENIKRERPQAGDIVLLLGGRTGRDGIGGATGSSKAHSEDTVESCGAEVQKGNPPTERKLQRLFRNPAFAELVLRCNDFGAGGVSVAVGELADGLDITLDNIQKKYQGLSASELALSESQERMAVVASRETMDRAIELATAENLECYPVAQVTDKDRLRLFYKGKAIVDLSRRFLDSSGVRQRAKAWIKAKKTNFFESETTEEEMKAAKKTEVDSTEKETTGKDNKAEHLKLLLSKKRSALQKGMAEMFDSTIGSATVLMPFGGKYQLSPSIAMAAYLPAEGMKTATVAAHGFNPYLSEQSPFLGAVYAVVLSVIKAAVSGADYDSIYLTFQEFFQKLSGKPERFAQPVAALLGAIHAQLGLEKAAIGGKDSMSGSFLDLDVPPTLISFALGISKGKKVVPSVAKRSGEVYRYSLKRSESGVPDYAEIREFLKIYAQCVEEGSVDFATVTEDGGCMVAVAKALFGNHMGIEMESENDLFTPLLGDIIFGINSKNAADKFGSFKGKLQLLGRTNESGEIKFAHSQISVLQLIEASKATFEAVFPTEHNETTNQEKCAFEQDSICDEQKESCICDENKLDCTNNEQKQDCSNDEQKQTCTNDEQKQSSCLQKNKAEVFSYFDGSLIKRKIGIAKPTVFMPVFPGTNCEYDSERRFLSAGGNVDIMVIKNNTAAEVASSIEEMAKRIRKSNIIMIPGGFSGGDEPDGSGKFIAAAFFSAAVKDAVEDMLYIRDGLMLGICNGFQALIKTGLLPYGRIKTLQSDSPSLTFNTIGRHVSQAVKIRIASNLSPWLSFAKTGEVFNQAVSHGEGRFIADEKHIKMLAQAGQIVSQYVDYEGKPTMISPCNPNGSVHAIEAICSTDGRILGKMGHSERIGKDVCKNIDDTPWDLKIFEAGINYFK